MHSNLMVSKSLESKEYMRDIYGPNVNCHNKAYVINSGEI